MRTVQLSNEQIRTIRVALKRSEEQHKWSARKAELLDIQDYYNAKAKAESDLYDLFSGIEATPKEKESARHLHIITNRRNKRRLNVAIPKDIPMVKKLSVKNYTEFYKKR